jgi:hypothetical protein
VQIAPKPAECPVRDAAKAVSSTAELPSISAGLRALIWPIHHVTSVPAIMGIHGTIASVPWIFMRTVVSPERVHYAADGVRLPL